MTIESNVGIPSKFSPVHEEEEENDDFVIGDSFEVGSTDSADTATTGLASASISNSSKVVLVTGGAGFIGSHVADFLLARGDKVIIVDEMNDYYDIRLKQGNLDYLANKYPTISHGTTKSNYVNRDNARCIIYKGDICNESFISLIFQVEKPNYICHLAARAGVRASILDPYIYVHSNIEGTTRLLDLARQYMCVNFVYASSSSVYGCSEKSILSESDVVEKPVSPYAATKKACELLAYTFHHLYGLNCTGLRFFTVYGPRGRPDMAPYKFIERVFTNQAIQQYGDGSTSRDYTYIDDIVSGVVAAIDKPLGCEVFNLGNGRPYLLRDFISLVEKCVGKSAIIEYLPEQPGDVDRTCADISKAQKLLGYSPKISFEEGISRTTEWYRTAFPKINSPTTIANNLATVSVSPQTTNLSSSSADKAFALPPAAVQQGTSPLSLNNLMPPPLSLSRNSSANTGAVSNTPNKSKKRPALHRDESDLELSSYVEKAHRQYKTRTRRILTNQPPTPTGDEPSP